MTELAEAALAYARAGRRVLPLVPGEKRPATRHGLCDAVSDPETVARWWRRDPSRNVGLAVGVRELVVDLDRPEALVALDSLGVELPATVEAATPRGSHRWYKLPAGATARPAVAVGGIDGLDIRAGGAYVVAPPSVVAGVLYRWSVPLDPEQMAEAPAALLALLASPGAPSAGGRVLPFTGERRGETPIDAWNVLADGLDLGRRNRDLFRACAQLRHYGATEAQLDKYAHAVAALCRPPLPEREVACIVRSVVKRYQPEVTLCESL